MPYPKQDEKQDDYISRCMGDAGMGAKHGDEKQRVAICYSYWKQHVHKAGEWDESKHPRDEDGKWTDGGADDGSGGKIQEGLSNDASKFREEGSQTYISSMTSPNMGERTFIDISHKDKSIERQQARFAQKRLDALSSRIRTKGGVDTYVAEMTSPNMGTRVFIDVRRRSMQKSFTAEIVKADADKNLVFGWASVIEKADGTPVVDSQGDVLMPDELEKAAYKFVLEVRKAGEMHQTVEGVGQLVESVVLTKAKREAMGLPPGPTGWWVGFKVSPEVFAKVKSGQYGGFSIGGRGLRKEVDALPEVIKRDDVAIQEPLPVVRHARPDAPLETGEIRIRMPDMVGTMAKILDQQQATLDTLVKASNEKLVQPHAPAPDVKVVVNQAPTDVNIGLSGLSKDNGKPRVIKIKHDDEGRAASVEEVVE